MTNQYAKGEKVTVRTYVREWDDAAGAWVNMPYAHCEGTVYGILPNGELIVETDKGKFTVNPTRIVNAGSAIPRFGNTQGA